MERSGSFRSSHAFRDAVLRGYAEADLPKPPTKEETTVSSPKILRALEIAQAIIENKEPPPYTEEEEEDEEEGEEEEIDPLLELLAPAPAPLPAKQQQSSSRRPSISRSLPRLVEERAPAASQTPSQPTRPETVTTMNEPEITPFYFNLQGLDATAWPSMPSTAQTYRSVMTPPKYYGPPPVRRPIDPNVTPNPTNANELMHLRRAAAEARADDRRFQMWLQGEHDPGDSMYGVSRAPQTYGVMIDVPIVGKGNQQLPIAPRVIRGKDDLSPVRRQGKGPAAFITSPFDQGTLPFDQHRPKSRGPLKTTILGDRPLQSFGGTSPPLDLASMWRADRFLETRTFKSLPDLRHERRQTPNRPRYERAKLSLIGLRSPSRARPRAVG